jgi:hypothetical protein
MFDPRQVRQGVEFRSSSGASWMAGRVRTRICLTGTRVAKAASTRAPPVVAVFARSRIRANLDEESSGEHVTASTFGLRGH